jgi:hypothetical protein
MHGSGSEYKYKEYADKYNAEGSSTAFKYMLHKGERIEYNSNLSK